MGSECAKNLILSSSDYHRAAAEMSALPDLKGSAEAIQIDVTAEDSIIKAVEQVSKDHHRLDILVNNAGIGKKSTASPPSQRLRDVVTTNTIGPVLVIEKFLDLLRKSSTPRLVFVSSSGGSLTHAADPNSPHYGSKTGMQFSHYRASKTALNMLLIEYHKMLGEEGFKVMGADPGLVVTNFLEC